MYTPDDMLLFLDPGFLHASFFFVCSSRQLLELKSCYVILLAGSFTHCGVGLACTSLFFSSLSFYILLGMVAAAWNVFAHFFPMEIEI